LGSLRSPENDVAFFAIASLSLYELELITYRTIGVMLLVVNWV
jgi:hypothetical protein